MQIKHLMPELLVMLPGAHGLAGIPVLLQSYQKGLKIFGDAAASPGVRYSIWSPFGIYKYAALSVLQLCPP